MSLFKSWIPNRTLRKDYDLPLWQTDEPQLFPPPPIMASVYSPSNASAVRESTTSPRTYDLVVLQKREKYYQQQLQELLNAQADGLTKGLGGVAEEGDGSADTPTQTTYSQRSNSVSRSPVGRQRKKGLSLAAARRGIYERALDCAAVKEEEDVLLRREIREESNVLQQLEAWAQKENELKDRITSVENQGSGGKLQPLKDEGARLQGEIKDMEVRLAQMRKRHRHIMAEISGIESSVQAELSSYKNALKMLRRDVDEFLSSPPINDEQLAPPSPLLSLPRNRRTLEMAKDYWSTNVNALKEQRKEARRARLAAEEGAAVWKDVVSEVVTFERFLKDEMKQMQEDAGTRISQVEPRTSQTKILERMDAVSTFLSDKLELARSKSWRLLMVSIEAELQAFEQGRNMFEEIFNVVVTEPEQLIDDQDVESEEGEHEQLSGQSSTKDVFVSANEERLEQHGAGLHKSLYEDPDPDLLFTRREVDDDTE